MESAFAPQHSSVSIVAFPLTRELAMKMTKAAKKIGKVMSEYKAGKLHSGGSGKVVKSKDQAVAIALSSAGKSKPMKRGK